MIKSNKLHYFEFISRAALERRKSQMIASIEERNGLDRHGSLAGSFNGGSELLRPHESSEAASLSRRCSRHSRRSQRSSLGKNDVFFNQIWGKIGYPS